jgi:hypothetical protein
LRSRKVNTVVPDLQSIRTTTRQQRRPRWITHGLLAVSMPKNTRRSSQDDRDSESLQQSPGHPAQHDSHPP